MRGAVVANGAGQPRDFDAIARKGPFYINHQRHCGARSPCMSRHIESVQFVPPNEGETERRTDRPRDAKLRAGRAGAIAKAL
jgi:hypothetical protein